MQSRAVNQEQYVVFGIDNEQYAICIQDIHEIIKMQDITQIPNLSKYVEGVIHLRGKIVPVINMRQLLQISEEPYSKHTRIIVVHHMQETLGIIVDRVDRVATFSDIQPPPESVGGNTGTFLTGIGVSDGRLIGILKVDELLPREKEM